MKTCLSLILAMVLLTTVQSVRATEPACAAAGLHSTHCRDPLLGEWLFWRFAMGERQGPLRPNEAAALEDAVRFLREAYPCGVTHAVMRPSWKTSSELWTWPVREEGVAIQFIGFTASNNRECSGQITEQAGFILLRRERKVSCPKDFFWMVRDDRPGLCIRD